MENTPCTDYESKIAWQKAMKAISQERYERKKQAKEALDKEAKTREMTEKILEQFKKEQADKNNTGES